MRYGAGRQAPRRGDAAPGGRGLAVLPATDRDAPSRALFADADAVRAPRGPRRDPAGRRAAVEPRCVRSTTRRRPPRRRVRSGASAMRPCPRSTALLEWPDPHACRCRTARADPWAPVAGARRGARAARGAPRPRAWAAGHRAARRARAGAGGVAAALDGVQDDDLQHAGRILRGLIALDLRAGARPTPGRPTRRSSGRSGDELDPRPAARRRRSCMARHGTERLGPTLLGLRAPASERGLATEARRRSSARRSPVACCRSSIRAWTRRHASRGCGPRRRVGRRARPSARAHAPRPRRGRRRDVALPMAPRLRDPRRRRRAASSRHDATSRPHARWATRSSTRSWRWPAPPERPAASNRPRPDRLAARSDRPWTCPPVPAPSSSAAVRRHQRRVPPHEARLDRRRAPRASELTAGTTWHAAGLITSAGMSTETLLWMCRYTRDLCASLEAETGLSTGFRPIGHLHLATTPQRLETLRREAAFVRGFGVKNHEISAAEFARHWPAAKTDDVLAAFYVPDEGRANPADLDPGIRQGRADAGREDHRGRTVTGVTARTARVTGVVTDQGTSSARSSSTAAGMWAPRGGRARPACRSRSRPRSTTT